jgi:hypothetical protein
VKPDPCPLCGANRSVVGRVHRCVPLQVAPAPSRPPPDIDVANALANYSTVDVANGSAKAQGRNRCSTTYRYRNPDKRRAYQRDLMRQRRAAGRAA